jgi:hypothetical protein
MVLSEFIGNENSSMNILDIPLEELFLGVVYKNISANRKGKREFDAEVEARVQGVEWETRTELISRLKSFFDFKAPEELKGMSL